MKLEYVGGHIWSAEEPGPDGHMKTIVSVELEPGNNPFIGCLSRPLDKSELDQLILRVYIEGMKNGQR